MASEDFYGYIYKVIHLPTNRYYIGQSIYKGSEPSKDGYLGSGVAWRNILNSHPTKEFKKIILAFAKSQEELNKLEFVYIGDKYQSDPLCINRRSGGDQPGMSQETKDKISQASKGNISWARGPHAKEIAKRISEHSKGKIISKEQRLKISQSRKGKCLGNKGSLNFHWYNNGTNNIYCKEIPKDFVPGRLYSPWQKGKR